MRTRLGVAAGLVSAGLVTACTGQDDGASRGSSASPSQVTSQGPSPTEASPGVGEPVATGREARATLRRAILALVRAESGRFQVEAIFGDQGGTVQSGSYRTSPPATDLRIQLSNGGPPRVMFSVRSVDDTTWMRVGPVDPSDEEVQNWPCWVDFADVIGMPGFPEEYAALAGAVGSSSAAVAAASYGVGADVYEGGLVEGRADLGSVLGMASGRLVVELGVDLMGDTTVPASFAVDDGLLTGFAVDYRDLPSAIVAAGGEQELAARLFGPVDGAITARFSEIGEPVDIQAPPGAEILDLAPGEDFETALTACGQN